VCDLARREDAPPDRVHPATVATRVLERLRSRGAPRGDSRRIK
jgi:hypothetical protein